MPEPNPELMKFIVECRKRGYEDYQIRIPLLENGWELNEVQAAFYELKLREDKKLKKKQTKENKVVYVYKNSMTIHLDEEVFKIIGKRAKKNMLTPEEQVEDIVRRSCVNTKKTTEVTDNVDDLLLRMFSRKNTGRPRE
jgi:hypothetical protein